MTIFRTSQLALLCLLTLTQVNCASSSPDYADTVTKSTAQMSPASAGRMLDGTGSSSVDNPVPVPEDDFEFDAWYADSIAELFGEDGPGGMILDAAVGDVGGYVGSGVLQLDEPDVKLGSFELQVDRVLGVEVGMDAAGQAVTTTYVQGNISTSDGSVDAYMAVVSVESGATTWVYLLPLQPVTPGRVGSEDSGSFGGGTYGPAGSDDCQDCKDDHDDAATKAKRRYRRCRSKALWWGGGATVLASFGGPWGTAGGLLATAAALDACNDTMKDAKEEGEEAFCECWEELECPEDDSDFEDTCTSD